MDSRKWLVINSGQMTDKILIKTDDKELAKRIYEQNKKKNNWLTLYLVEVEEKIRYIDTFGVN